MTVKTWGDRPDARVTDDMLGPSLAQPNCWGRWTHDEQHYQDMLPQIYQITGNPLIRDWIERRLQMGLAHRRRWDRQWPGVPRAIGRYCQQMTAYAQVLPEHRAAVLQAVTDILEVVVDKWDGVDPKQDGYRVGTTYYRSPWQRSECVRGVWFTAREFSNDWSNDLNLKVIDLLANCSRTVVEDFADELGPNSVGQVPYLADGRPAEERWGWWSRGGLQVYEEVVTAVDSGGVGLLEKATRLLTDWRAPQSPQEARWCW